MTRMVATAALAIVLASACSPQGPPDVALGGGGGAAPSAGPSEPAGPPGSEVAWRHLATTEGMLQDSAAAEAVESPADLAAAWKRYRLPSSAPEIDFGRSFVLLLGQADDACVDELIELGVREGSLHVEWLPPPGGCDQPLIFRIHAVAVDRRHVPSKFEVAFEEPFAQDAKPVTIEVASVAGPAPAPPEPPRSMTKAEVDAVFDGHVIRRCTKADQRLENPPPDDAVSDDPPPQSEVAASELLDDVRRWLRGRGYRSDVDFVPYISRADGVRPGIWVDGGAAAQVQRLVDEQFGDGAVVVEENGYDFEAVAQAQDDVSAIMGGEGAGSIVSVTGLPGPVELGMIDPTRASLDRVAQTVDPSLVCVYPILSGVAAD